MTPQSFWYVAMLVIGIIYLFGSFRAEWRPFWGIGGFFVLFIMLLWLAYIGLGSPTSSNNGGFQHRNQRN